MKHRKDQNAGGLAVWLVVAVLVQTVHIARGCPFHVSPPGEEVFVALDTETTGLNPNEDRIIEIALVRFQRGGVLARQSWMINPDMPIPPESTLIHGISDAMVADAPRFREVYPEVLTFLGRSRLVIHNARFDMNFLNAEAERAGLEKLPNRVIDSLRLFRKTLSHVENYRLATIGAYLGCESDTLHRAGSDADLLAKCLIKWLDEKRDDASEILRQNEWREPITPAPVKAAR